jgi:hypothetical protein
MRRITLLTLALTPSGCGYNTWWNPSFTGGYNPNLPVHDSENLRRVQGHEPPVSPLTTEPGDIWPGPLAPAPTLTDLEAAGGLTSHPEAPVPGSPLSREVGVTYRSRNPSAGSSTAPASAQLRLSPPQPDPPFSSYTSPPASPSTHEPAGQVIQSPNEPAVTTGDGPGDQTTTTPGGEQSIIVPNGNGTSSVIRPDGQIATIPTPK